MFDEPFEEKKPEEKKPEREEVQYGIEISCEEPARTVTSGTTCEYNLVVKNVSNRRDKTALKINLMYTTFEGDESPEWGIHVDGADYSYKEAAPENIIQKEIELGPDQERTVLIEIGAPKGARYGDRLDLIISAVSESDPALTDNLTITTTTRQTIMAVKTSIGHEKTVADSLASRAKAKDANVFAILSPATLRGYLLVEAMNVDSLREVVKGIRRARGLVEGETTFAEVDHFLTPKPLVSGITEGDIVELIAGPFKGEKARVQQIDENKEEITVELFEAMVPIPVTVRGDSVRVLEKEAK